MKKAIVIGCPGSGKSTFARRLRDLTGLPLSYLDMLWHRPDRTHVSREVFDARLKEVMSGEEWIIDGNYQRTLEVRLCACDAVFLMDYPLDVCLAGAKARVGRKREEMPWTETEFDSEFEQWILDFPNKQLPEIYRMLKEYQAEKDIFIFKSREEAEAYLQALPDRRA
jgi:adenylate kinase family enzyme